MISRQGHYMQAMTVTECVRQKNSSRNNATQPFHFQQEWEADYGWRVVYWGQVMNEVALTTA